MPTKKAASSDVTLDITAGVLVWTVLEHSERHEQFWIRVVFKGCFQMDRG